MNYRGSDNVPVNDLAKEWNVTPQKIVNMIGVAKRSTMFFNELVDKGYVVDEIPRAHPM